MNQPREGQHVPEITFRTRRDDAWVDITSQEIFTGRTVVVFSLPGAFTPTCSAAHVPRFNELAGVLRENGVDEIVCVSVNDAFVMNEWAKDQGADNITFLPDGNGEFSAAMGMLVDKRELGFGMRSWRYSMLVKDGIIEKMFVEPQVPGDPYEVSDADTMLDYINPRAPRPLDVVVFSRPGCPYCAAAKAALAERRIAYEDIAVGAGVSMRGVRAATGSETVPQVFINGERIGDSEALSAWFRARERRASAA
ncbi:MAG: glutathione peroxidase [Gammaproteobacteria bacterium]|jgi:glutaredoxin-like protein